MCEPDREVVCCVLDHRSPLAATTYDLPMPNIYNIDGYRLSLAEHIPRWISNKRNSVFTQQVIVTAAWYDDSSWDIVKHFEWDCLKKSSFDSM